MLEIVSVLHHREWRTGDITEFELEPNLQHHIHLLVPTLQQQIPQQILHLNGHDNLLISGPYLVLLIINTFLLQWLMVTLATHYTQITDVYAHLKNVSCQRGQTQVGHNNTLSIWFLLKQQLNNLLVMLLLLKNHALMKHKFVLEACLFHK
ncbi:hypothetical protein DVH24_030188 [Malus domestica]|uniref:Uncharacterized protein n=1 Tax=Malus domestica TaxID=3750 RepID=A0A498I0R9_MALDO|nr:hypothetical protein DVH24_030188 [Malus domestica]